MDEQYEQTAQMPNWRYTGTVPPAWYCWYEPTHQCVSRECLGKANPTRDCPKRNHWYGNKI